ncbi:MAG: patatin-like phospholipase family protein [Dechloromonas sp.]|nr:patatin-like phospholipase family protein [Dechloromonas sp.]
MHAMTLHSVSSVSSQPQTVAIACQGGGSHTAFTAGVLQTLLNDLDTSRYRITGLSGTSGGALCAAIAWYGLLQGDAKKGAQLLASFWQKMSASLLPDRLSNQFLLGLQRSRSFFPTPDISPYLLPNIGQDFLAKTIREHIKFELLPDMIGPDSPTLMVGAVDVLSGSFTVFDSRASDREFSISVEALLASAAIPELFRAVRIGQRVYWDGLFSQNPPIRGFLSGLQNPDAKPDEIWVIQINPETRSSEPRSTTDINDRRNELSGNLSLNQELFFVRQTNEWLEKKWLNADHFKRVDIRNIPLETELDYPSKLDRNPEFINALQAEGRRKGKEFLSNLAKAQP